MQNLQFCSAGGRKYRIDLPAPLEGFKGAYLFSFHKSGSTLMDNMVRQYCKFTGTPTFSLFNSAFDCGIPTSEIMKDAAVCFSDAGRVYTGFRHYPKFELNLTGMPCVLLVRDPRDMLVSMYYSVAKSHVLPRGNLSFVKRRWQAMRMSVDEFAIKKADEYMRSFQKYKNKLPEETLVTYRYEDVIYKKEAWLKDLVKYLGLPRDDGLIRNTASKFDVFPEQEDENKHIRQVHPGNYKKKLKHETIEVINQTLEEFLNYYNYS